jgi:hypothetical protein
MTAIPHRAGLYLALLKLFFMLCWTVYAIYLPALAATAGIPRSADARQRLSARHRQGAFRPGASFRELGHRAFDDPALSGF